MDFAGWDAALDVGAWLTGAPGGVIVWAALVAGLWLWGRPLESIVLALSAAIWAPLALLESRLTQRGPGDDLAAVAQIGERIAFPSGQITLAVAVFGMLAVIAMLRSASWRQRAAVVGPVGLIVAAAAASRSEPRAQDTTAVLGGLLLGGAWLALLSFVYRELRAGRAPGHGDTTLAGARLLGRLLGPLLGHRARYRAPAADGVRLAGSIASTVYLDDRAGVARKVYRASRPVQVLYWAAFQAPFPYGTRESALQTAAAVRELTGLLTRYWTGDDLVSRVTAIRFRENAGPSGLSQQGGGRWELESELVPGEEPRDNAEVAEELRFLRRRFAQAGLPTWQIDIENPHAHTNLIRRPDGRLRIIDLESTLVPLIQPIGRWPQMLRSGRAPLFDDLDYGRLRSYVAAERKGLAATLGADVLRLDAAIDAAEAWSREWKDAEPAIWGRLAQAESLATAFVETALDRWLAEGRIPASEAAATRDRLREEGTRTGMRHLGMAVAVSVPLRFPLGSLTRCAMVLSFRRRARSAYQAGEIDEASYRSARETHTRLVALVALIPGLGAGAYLLSAPLRRSGNLAPLLLDQPCGTHRSGSTRGWDWGRSCPRASRRSGRRSGRRRGEPGRWARSSVTSARTACGLRTSPWRARADGDGCGGRRSHRRRLPCARNGMAGPARVLRPALSTGTSQLRRPVAGRRKCHRRQ